MIKRKYYLRTWCSIYLLLMPLQQAHAGAWTLPEGKTELYLNSFYYSTDESFDRNGNRGSSPEFSKFEINPYVEYGLQEGITVGMSTFLQYLTQENAEGGEDTNTGLADTELFARFQLYEEDGLVLSVQPLLKLGSSYSSDSPRAGRSESDAELSVLGGYGFQLYDQNHFVQTKLAYRRRFGDLDDQLKLEATLGIRAHEDWLIIPEYSRTSPVGSNDGTLFSISGQNDYTLNKLQLSAVYEWNDTYAFQAGAFSHIDGENTGAGGGVLFSIWRRW